jgi:poly-beta-1,6-N-acetyl-D-glucosamine biosynthesis protein PgaD
MIKRRPLIISRPELQSWLRRLFAFIFTLAAWVVWLLLLIPMLWMAAARFGLHLPELHYFSRIDSVRLGQLLEIFPLALLVIISGLVLLLANGLIVKLWRATRKAPMANPDMNRVVTDANVDSTKFSIWQSARIVQVEHGPRGRVKDIQVVLLEDKKSQHG